MPSLSTEDIQSIERLSEEYGISFHANLDSSQWPISHRQLFQDVHDLTERRFQTYAVDIATQTNEPWKEEIKYLAEELTSNSSHCTGANEDTWRSACEPIIFARLSSEVNWSVLPALIILRALFANLYQPKMSGANLAIRDHGGSSNILRAV